MLVCAPICEEESSRDLRREVGEGRAGCPWLGKHLLDSINWLTQGRPVLGRIDGVKKTPFPPSPVWWVSVSDFDPSPLGVSSFPTFCFIKSASPTHWVSGPYVKEASNLTKPSWEHSSPAPHPSRVAPGSSCPAGRERSWNTALKLLHSS